MRKWFFIVLPLIFLLIYIFANYMFSSVKENTAKTFQSESNQLELYNNQINKKSPPPKNSLIKSLSSRFTKKPNKYIQTSNQVAHNYPEESSATSKIQTQESLEPNPTPPPSQKTAVQQTPSVNPTTFISSPSPTQDFSIEFVNTQILNPGVHQNIPIGGLSALSYNPNTETFFALSDDKGQPHTDGQSYPPRFYEMELQTENEIHNFELKKQIFLLSGNNQPIRGIDPEGMAFLSPDKIFISSEGAQTSTLTIPPALFEYDINGQVKVANLLKGMFWDDQQLGSYGVKENKAFEALTVDVNNNQLWLATEKSLHQDDPIQSENANSQSVNTEYIRFTQMDLDNMKINAQYVYPMQSYYEQDSLSGDNGVTDFLFLEDKRFIVIERAYLIQKNAPAGTKQDANLIRLFLADCSQANNVAIYPTLQRGSQFVTCGKTPIINDLSNTVNGYVDNIEGIAKGPEVSPGQFVLVLASDNNFSSNQKNQFLFFHYKPDFQ